MNEVVKNIDKKIDELELVMSDFPMQECPLKHTLTESQYIREIFMPAGTLVTSMVHLTEHPYFVMKGVVSVFSENDGEQLIEAPYSGITTPHTRRVLYIHEDTIWATVHSRLPNETIDEIANRILDKYDNPLLSEDIKNKYLSLSRYGLDTTKTILNAH